MKVGEKGSLHIPTKRLQASSMRLFIQNQQKGDSSVLEVCQPLIDEFVARYRYGRLRKPLNSNAIMKERNLMKMKEAKG